MTSNEIRKRFLDFFAARGHRVVRSSSLVPANDPTLLFANAGMNQFKDVFLGGEKRDYTRACSSQKCVRAGGKHNDLEQVGRTTRHHTFFEMLGNFSFGDYFKKQAIPWAWELVTKEFAIPREKLYVTTFLGSGSGPEDHDVVPRDDEAHELWVAQGVGEDRIFKLGLQDNFWQMGDTGPCGPCSEIHYDLGPAASELGHADCKFPCDCGRFVELWNLVFMQYNRYCRYERDGYPADWDEKARADHKHSDDRSACLALDLLPKPSIDTGAGLERLAAVLQGKLSNFDTDLFRPLIEEAAELAKIEYGANHETDVSLRVIADHARAATFLISDGVIPSNEGRGYVLRLIIRRALYHGQTLGVNEPFLFKMSGHVVDMMKGPYPELLETAHHVAKAIKSEEEKYERTTQLGLQKLDITMVAPYTGVLIPFGHWRDYLREGEDNLRRRIEEIAETTPNPAKREVDLGYKAKSQHHLGIIPGDDLFLLHDTFGLRPEFVASIVSPYQIGVDLDGYQVAMQRQRELARAFWKGAEKKLAQPVYQQLGEKQKTEFDGYLQTTSPHCKIVAIVQSGESVNEAKPGDEIEIVLDHTPFYAESGGQVGDQGHLLIHGSAQEQVAHITDTYRPVSGVTAHKAVAREALHVGDVVTGIVDKERREAILRNHTGTHLLHAALRQTLGPHVKQAGSLVAPDRLRFDFSHYAALGEQDLLDIEDLVNQHVLANEEMRTEVMDLDTAINTGAMALFGEKYGDKVRVVSVADGSFSKELCGGTHVHRTGDIGLFKVVSESSVAAGTRRIEALTGVGVLEYLRLASDTLKRVAEVLQGRPEEAFESVLKLAESERRLRKQLESKEMKALAIESHQLISLAQKIKGVFVIFQRVEPMSRDAMRQLADNCRAQIKSGVIVLGSAADGKAALIVAVTKDLTDRLDAGKIVKVAAAIVGGSGGGRKDLAEAGGTQPEKLDESLQAIPSIIEQML